MAAVFEMFMILRMKGSAFQHARQEETNCIEVEEKTKKDELI